MSGAELIGHVLNNGWTIVAAKDRSGCSIILAKKGLKNEHVDNEQWVTAVVNPRSIANGEWFWGHYFDEEEPARKDWDARA